MYVKMVKSYQVLGMKTNTHTREGPFREDAQLALERKRVSQQMTVKDYLPPVKNKGQSCPHKDRPGRCEFREWQTERPK